ncbi:MAG: IS3 family transposase [Clostridia bacterium]|nr:IS3 family transposase [Clostridia bacterium]
MIPIDERCEALALIDKAVLAGAKRFKACEILGITIRTYHRWISNPSGDRRKGADKHIPRKLTDDESKEILHICCNEKYKDMTPYCIYYSLLEEDSRYIASIRSFYRVLRANNKLHHRGNSKPSTSKNRPPEVIATGPNQVWCWDITWLATEIKGVYLYAYKIIDIWDKELVGWEIHDREDEKLARDLFHSLQFKYNLKGIHLHSDNGHPMKGMSLLSFLYSMKISVSRSRPRVSNDNPFIESYFKTMKYSVCYPGYFKDINHARSWMADFVDWYNTKHRHSGLNFVTPQQMRSGEYKRIFKKRNQILKAAYEKHPERWSQPPKQWNGQHKVYLNPSLETQQTLKKNKNAA